MIIRKKNAKMTYFKDLNRTDCFLYQGEMFMVTEPYNYIESKDSYSLNAVCLEDGCFALFDKDDLVERVEAILTYEEKAKGNDKNENCRL